MEHTFAGWPRHTENSEFGSKHFQTVKTGNLAVRDGKVWQHRENFG